MTDEHPWEVPEAVWQQPSSTTPPPASQLPRQAGRKLGCAVSVVFMLVASIVVGGLIFGGIFLFHLKDRIPGAHKEQFQTAQGLNRVMELTRQKFGDTLGYSLGVHPDSFSVQRVDPDNPQRQATYYWYSWKGQFGDPSSIISLESTPPVDLSKFDANAAAKVLHDAPSMLHIDPSAVKSSFFIIRADKKSPGAVEVDVFLDTRKGTGQILLAPDGTVKQTISDF
jgi:hypothetical protein